MIKCIFLIENFFDSLQKFTLKRNSNTISNLKILTVDLNLKVAQIEFQIQMSLKNVFKSKSHSKSISDLKI